MGECAMKTAYEVYRSRRFTEVAGLREKSGVKNCVNRISSSIFQHKAAGEQGEAKTFDDLRQLFETKKIYKLKNVGRKTIYEAARFLAESGGPDFRGSKLRYLGRS